MPELPEVETTRRSLLRHVVGSRIEGVIVRDPRLRWPVTPELPRHLAGEDVLAIRRRGKYLLFDCREGHLMVHLGMSGKLSLVSRELPAGKHDHVDIRLAGGRTLRYTDPRRFGAVLWLQGAAEDHALLRGLGIEPLGRGFTGKALRECARGRRVSIKQFLMNGRIVVGVGNIYASEALFQAGIHPAREAGTISLARWERLAQAVRSTLERAIGAGGTTLRDFADSRGRPGHFQHEFSVYGRAGGPCPRCGSKIRISRQGQRSTYHCPRCQR